MIKFFRKIRQNLLMENKTGKYFKYAVGEIVLVVIGILIALQINNWNELRKNKNLEIDYLKGIKTNIADDILELEKHFLSDTIVLNSYTFLIRAFDADNLESNKQDIISNVYATNRLHWFEGQDVVFDDMKSSGRFNIIQSDSIKYLIQKYYKFSQEVIKQESQYLDVTTKYTMENNKYYNVSSFIEPTFINKWNGNTGPPVLLTNKDSDFYQKKLKLIDNLSIIKSQKYASHKVRLQLYQKAILLQKKIEQYLVE
jgi:hypothetical protein